MHPSTPTTSMTTWTACSGAVGSLGSHVQVVADGPHHHLAAMQPDPAGDGHAAGPPDLAGILLHRRLHSKGGIAGPHGVVFMGDGGAEECHDAVAHNLVHGPLIATHGRHHAFEHGVENRTCLFGVA